MDGDENDMIPVKDMTEKEKHTRNMFQDKGNAFAIFSTIKLGTLLIHFLTF